jgi:hypothetical protein
LSDSLSPPRWYVTWKPISEAVATHSKEKARPEVKISNEIELPNDWRKFDLNVGGFGIRGCRWHVPRGRIVFPRRYDRGRGRHRVIFVHGRLVMRLRELLESDQESTPRDRRPCKLGIQLLGRSRREPRQGWIVFNFTVRGFKILGCRWHPDLRSIQLPVTFRWDDQTLCYAKKRIVCAYGCHINRLRNYLEIELARIRAKRAEAQEARPVAA